MKSISYYLQWPLRARKTILAFVLCIIFSASSAQDNYSLDSLKQIVQEHKQNDSTADVLFRFALTQGGTTPDKFIEAVLAALSLYEAQSDSSGQASSLLLLQGVYREMGQYPTSLKHAKNGLALARNSGLLEQKIWRGQRSRSLFLAELAQTFLLLNQLDSAEYYTKSAVAENELMNGSHWNFPIYLLTTIQTIEGRHIEAENSFRKAYTLYANPAKNSILYALTYNNNYIR